MVNYLSQNLEALRLIDQAPALVKRILANQNEPAEYKPIITPKINTNAIVCFGFNPALFNILELNPNISIIGIFEWEDNIAANALSNFPFFSLIGQNKQIILGYSITPDIYGVSESIESTTVNSILKNHIKNATVINFKSDNTLGQTLEIVFRNSLMKFGGGFNDSIIGFNNMIDNMDYICNLPGITIYENQFKGVPALIVGASPDIDDERIAQIKEVQNKFVIFAVDAIYAKLKKAGIRVDFVTSLERVRGVKHFFEGIPPQNTILIACPVLYRECIEAFLQKTGRAIMVARPFSHFQFLEMEHIKPMDTGPSSFNMALIVAYFWGFRNFVLIGESLSFGDQNQTHAQGVHDIANIDPSDITEYVQDGKKLFTTQAMIWFKIEMERFLYKNKDAIVYNATRGGLTINGTKQIDFMEYIQNAQLQDIQNIEFKWQIQPLQETKKLLSLWDYKKGTALTYLKSMIEKCQKIRPLIDLLDNDITREESFLNVIIPLCDSIYNYLCYGAERNLFYFILVHIIQTELLNLENEKSLLFVDNNPDKHRRYLGIIEEVIDIIERACKECIKKLIE